jgi:hypothetical protein
MPHVAHRGTTARSAPRTAADGMHPPIEADAAPGPARAATPCGRPERLSPAVRSPAQLAFESGVGLRGIGVAGCPRRSVRRALWPRPPAWARTCLEYIPGRGRTRTWREWPTCGGPAHEPGATNHPAADGRSARTKSAPSSGAEIFGPCARRPRAARRPEPCRGDTPGPSAAMRPSGRGVGKQRADGCCARCSCDDADAAPPRGPAPVPEADDAGHRADPVRRRGRRGRGPRAGRSDGGAPPRRGW